MKLSYIVRVGKDVFLSGLWVPPATSLLTMTHLPLVAGLNDMPSNLMVSPEVAHHFVYLEEEDGNPHSFVDFLDEDDTGTKKPALQDCKSEECCTIDDAADNNAMAEDNNPGGEEATPVKHCSL
jgi:hypothetical protein